MYFQFSTKQSALAFCLQVNEGEGIFINENNTTTGYAQPFELQDKFYVIADDITSKYTNQEQFDLFSNANPITPAMTGYGILIPTEAETLNLFPNNQFKLGGFIINLTTTSQGLAVDLAFLGWQEFRDEQDKPQNETIKLSFSALWYELLTRYQNNEIIQL
jgi:hypothetical protein